MMLRRQVTALVRNALRRGAMVPVAGGLLVLGGAGPLAAQDVRISGTTTMNFVQLRPVKLDSVLASTTIGDGTTRLDQLGRTVDCVAAGLYCYVYSSGATSSSTPALQDLRLSAWGFGQGLSVYADVRGRGVIGGNTALWPQANDHFDALEAYVQLDRPHFQLRAGRQWDVSGLAFNNYDGASVLWRPRPTFSLEGYGGWTLATGLNEPVTSGALAAVEPFAPTARGLLMGVRAQAAPAPPLLLSAVYERTLATDRSGLYSNRFATNGVFRRGPMSLDWAAQVDLASQALNELRGQLVYAASSGVSVRAFARRHQPYFDLWTIWGAFGAVGFVEGGAGASWRRADGTLTFDGQATRRHYLQTNAEIDFAPLHSNGWSLSASGNMQLDPRWAVNGQYALDLGFGTAESQGALELRRSLGTGSSLALSGTAFQMADELRVNSGTVVGLGFDGALRLGPRSSLNGSVFDYRHVGRVAESGPDWNQVRATLTYSWTVGAEPGVTATTAQNRSAPSRAARRPSPRPVSAASVAASAAVATDSSPDSTTVFPHRLHNGLFPTCLVCHRGVPTGDSATMYPATTACGNCHDGKVEPLVPWTHPAPMVTNLVFSHVRHQQSIDSAGDAIRCLDCHRTPGDTSGMAVSRPQPQYCIGCHAHAAPSHTDEAARCGTCHVPLARTRLSVPAIASIPKPADHASPDWLLQHAPATPQVASARCAVCHARESCERCHFNAAGVAAIQALEPDQRVAELVRGRAPSYPKPVSHYVASWQWTHGVEVGGSALGPGGVTAAVETCSNCHTQASCRTCHRQGTTPAIQALPPQGPDTLYGVRVAPRPIHPVGWLKDHPSHAASTANCTSCHSTEFCVTCHQGQKAEYHPLNFVARHGPQAYNNDTQCSACHTTETFCRNCHLQQGLGTRTGEHAAFHDAQPHWLLNHGQAARQNLQACASCHTQGSCAQCHSATGGWRINPHPPGFDAARARKSNPQSCLLCHTALPG
jgi:hypothetical protein